MELRDNARRSLENVAVSSRISRRQILKRGGAVAGAAALLGGAQIAGAASEHTFELDVACDGNTWVITRSPDADPDEPVRRGDTFVVSGRVFPAGTIEQGLERPNQEGSIGHWICRGWFYHPLEKIQDGLAPFLVTNQMYLLDSYDGLLSEGTEGGIFTVRSITGGYGKYAAARGFVEERGLDTNSTTLDFGGGFQPPAPNIRFTFHLVE